MANNQIVQDYRNWIQELDRFYQKVNLGLFSQKRRNKFITCCSNAPILYSVFMLFLLSFLLTTETTDSYVAFQQLWTLLYPVQVIGRGINRIWRREDIDELINWFGSLYEPSYLEEYQSIIDEQLELQNKRVTKLLGWVIL